MKRSIILISVYLSCFQIRWLGNDQCIHWVMGNASTHRRMIVLTLVCNSKLPLLFLFYD